MGGEADLEWRRSSGAAEESCLQKRSGVAFVVVQHLDPADKGAIVELLQRSTGMPVQQARDGERLEPDRVYVIPPARDMSLLHGVIHLLPQTSPRGLNLPVDFFFRSLAADRQDRAVAVWVVIPISFQLHG